MHVHVATFAGTLFIVASAFALAALGSARRRRRGAGARFMASLAAALMFVTMVTIAWNFCATALDGAARMHDTPMCEDVRSGPLSAVLGAAAGVCDCDVGTAPETGTHPAPHRRLLDNAEFRACVARARSTSLYRPAHIDLSDWTLRCPETAVVPGCFELALSAVYGDADPPLKSTGWWWIAVAAISSMEYHQQCTAHNPLMLVAATVLISFVLTLTVLCVDFALICCGVLPANAETAAFVTTSIESVCWSVAIAAFFPYYLPLDYMIG
jgi:hypothetical protein